MDTSQNILVVIVLGVMLFTALAAADTLTTAVRFIINTDTTFSLFVPADNATNVTSTAAATRATQGIQFNYTALTLVKGNASATGVTQDATTAIFKYRNDGNVLINISINFTTNLTGRPQASSVVIKAAKGADGWQDSCSAGNLTELGTNCANITVNFTGNWPPRQVANLSISGANEDEDVWLWADWNGMAANYDQTATLQHIGVLDRP